MKEFMEVSSKGVDNFVIKGEGGKKYIVEGEDLGFFCAKGGEVRGVEGGRQFLDVIFLLVNDVFKQLEIQVLVYRFI